MSNTPSEASPVTVACQAMATRFEIVLHGEDPVSLRAAGEEALAEIRDLEAQLNLYDPASELSRVNARAAHEPIKVEPGLFNLLEEALTLSEATDGAFDITVAPLMRCWGFMRDTGRCPTREELEEAMAPVGRHHVHLDKSAFSVRFDRDDVMLDLGAIGKGYAIGAAADCLRESGVTSALIHGGTSTVYGLGHPPDQAMWKVAIEFPDQEAAVTPAEAGAEIERNLIGVVTLEDTAMSVSAVWGKAFQAEDKTMGHAIDPRTGQPTQNAELAAVVLPSALETDALATALLIGGRDDQEHITGLRSGMKTLVAGRSRDNAELWVVRNGIAPS